ncbi:secreted RxLR effector protein 161-like [Stegodyphus dumicola]|uniref:secreted RxLR effector protein 161-like n=1 Tax=Stegodyphus dumicola TaxID=202533 RepID=UPI0015AF4F24|nr:secreted RxLR effector protein 161-like [Stegodyphus dumicola]
MTSSLNYLNRSHYEKSLKHKKFLGIDIRQESGKLILSQENYITKILKNFEMDECKPIKTPGILGENLDDIASSPPVSKTKYQEALGSLMYLATGTRPDLAFAVSNLSRYNQDPREKHWKAVKRIFRYIKGTQNTCLVYTSDNGKLNATSDASWCTTEDGKSFGGYFIKLGKNFINWKCNKQRIVALSTMEAELLAFCECACEVKWYIFLLEELGQDDLIDKPIGIKTDCQALIDWIKKTKTK